MKYLTLLLLLLLTACAAPAPTAKKVDIVLRNTTDRPLDIRARAGFLGRTIRLEPGEEWTGWVPRNTPISEIRIDVVPIRE